MPVKEAIWQLKWRFTSIQNIPMNSEMQKRVTSRSIFVVTLERKPFSFVKNELLHHHFGIGIVALHCVDLSVTIFKDRTKHFVPKTIWCDLSPQWRGKCFFNSLFQMNCLLHMFQYGFTPRWFCSFNFASLHAGNLRSHLKTHDNEKPNKCNQCTAVFQYILSNINVEGTFENAQWGKAKQM